MKKVNYKSLKSVHEFVNKEFDLFVPLDEGKPYPFFFAGYKDKFEKIGNKLFNANNNWRNYKYKKVDFFGKDTPNYLKSFFGNKGGAVKKQVIDYINILATDSEDVYFLSSLFSYIYNANNFKSKKNKGQIATIEERKELLDFPLRILKMHKSNETFRLSVLYQIYSPDDYQYVLFNKAPVLCNLYNTNAFQQGTSRNRKELDLVRMEFFEKCMKAAGPDR